LKSGLIHTAEHETKKPIAGHLDDFEKSQKARNNTPRHVKSVKARIQRIIEYCGWKNPSLIS